VTTLLDGIREAGVHEELFNAEKLASGMYVCVLKSDSHVETRKMLLLR